MKKRARFLGGVANPVNQIALPKEDAKYFRPVVAVGVRDHEVYGIPIHRYPLIFDAVLKTSVQQSTVCRADDRFELRERYIRMQPGIARFHHGEVSILENGEEKPGAASGATFVDKVQLPKRIVRILGAVVVYRFLTPRGQVQLGTARKIGSNAVVVDSLDIRKTPELNQIPREVGVPAVVEVGARGGH